MDGDDNDAAVVVCWNLSNNSRMDGFTVAGADDEKWMHH